MINTIAVHGYRSLRELRVPLATITVVTGANGSGKSSLYRALRLLADCAEGQVVASLAREGRLPSTLWAGPEVISSSVRSGEHPVQGTARADRVSLQLGFASDEFSYLIDLGIPIPGEAYFNLDPEIKREVVWSGEVMRPATLLVKRRGPLVELRDGRGWTPVETKLRTYESMLTEVIDPLRAPELLWVREQVVLAVLRSLPHGPRGTGALTQIGTRTWCCTMTAGIWRGASRSGRSATTGLCMRRSLMPFRARNSPSGPRTAGSISGSPPVCSVRWARPSCRTEHCATSCWSPPCCRRGRPS